MRISKNISHKKKANAVFEGGGVKGIGIAGALEVAERYYEWENVAGTSAGAIIGALVTAGYSAHEIKELLLSLDFKELKDLFPVGKLPVAGSVLSILYKMGLYSGRYIEDWLNVKLAKKNVFTFGDLKKRGSLNKDSLRYRLQVITSDISLGKMIVLPRDLQFYGLNPDEFSVAKAVRMSISIPFFYKPVVVRYKKDNVEQVSYFVDGGILSNFPLWLFEKGGRRPYKPTIGFKLVDPYDGRPHNIDGPISFLTAMFSTMMEAHDRMHIEEQSYSRTIVIPTLGIRATDFDIGENQIIELYNSGVNAAKEFFKEWDFQRYLYRYYK